jgi:hypothetical protein
VFFSEMGNGQLMNGERERLTLRLLTTLFKTPRHFGDKPKTAKGL